MNITSNTDEPTAAMVAAMVRRILLNKPDGSAWEDVMRLAYLDARALAAPAAEVAAWVNSDELDNMLDDRTATIQGKRDGWRGTPLYRGPAITTQPAESKACASVGVEPVAQWQIKNGGQWCNVDREPEELFKAKLPVRALYERPIAALASPAPSVGEPKRDWRNVDKAIQQYLDMYELRGEDEHGADADHSPTDFERYLLEDAINGLLADQDFTAAYFATPPAAPAATEAPSDCEGCNGHGMVGGLRQDGYHSEECPFCKGSGVATPAPAVGASVQPSDWLLIDGAPKDGRTLLLGYYNSAGNWRTLRGRWMSADYIAENWEEPDEGEPGWYETVVESEDIPNAWRTTPTHYQLLPKEPGACVQPVQANGELLRGWVRYEKARKLSPRQWSDLHARNLSGETFDDMIDALPEPSTPVPVVQPVQASLSDAERSMVFYCMSQMDGLSDADWRQHGFRLSTFERAERKLRAALASSTPTKGGQTS